MNKSILSIFAFFLGLQTLLFAQTTGTFIVADKTSTIESCIDSTITLNQIIAQAGIRDLNDPSDNASMYKMFRLEGSVITTDEITGAIQYSAYTQVYVKKMNPTGIGNHDGLPIYLHVTIPPTFLFKHDSINYTVEKGASVNILEDFFNELILFNSGKDKIEDIRERISITNESTGIETKWIDNADIWILGKGRYKMTATVAVCTEQDIYTDIMYVIVKETPCLTLEIKNLPALCRDEIIDIRPYVYLDGSVASVSDLGQMTFTNKSDLTIPAGTTFDPSAMNMNQMFNKLTVYPTFTIAYQPNVSLGICTNYTYMPVTKVPSKFITTDVVFTKDNGGKQVIYTVEGDYFGFNNIFNKEVFKKLYIDNYAVHTGTQLDFYLDHAYQSPVPGTTLAEGIYYIVATNPDCSNDSTVFTVTIKDRDFDITWQSATNVGQGYYTFTAPAYSGATYKWMAWSGSIVSGLGTNQITVYFSENSYGSPFVSCEIALNNTRTTGEGGPLQSAVYLTTNNGAKEEIRETITTGTTGQQTSVNIYAYPNPASQTFAVSGTEVSDISVYNALGQLVYSNSSYTADSPIALQGKGIHIVYIKQQGTVQTLKVVLQ